MNYLAHLFLSGDDPILRMGNLSGDFVKGVDVAVLHPTVMQGIALHQSIDAYTDHHEIVQRSKKRIIVAPPHFAGILVDVFYDHFLAKNWPIYCETPLEEYVSGVYADLHTYRALLPPSLQAILPRMINEDWLTSYRDIEGITQALRRIERRFGGKHELANSTSELERNRSELEDDFLCFFPELVAYVEGRIEQV